MWSKEVLNLGIIWKVGDGKSINARRDPWIPALSSGKITSNVRYDSNTTINNLTTEHLSWDVNVLNDRFLPYEVEAIRRVPIAGIEHSDSRYWRWDKKGIYSVKSDY